LPLTAAQLDLLHDDIATDPVLSLLPLNDDAAFTIAAAYNAVASPDHWAWRTKVTKKEFTQTAGPDGTTFNWTGNGFITRSAGEQAAWQELFNGEQAINPSLANVRQAIADILSGTGNAAANRTHMLAVGRRKVTRAEKLFATGTGSTASPAIMSFEGTISFQDVAQARAFPQ
jgi:hypothetical protein